jgi:histidyl-tRNA synthetase
MCRVFKHVEKLSAKRLVLLGTTEWEQGKVSVKDLTTREQLDLTVDQLIEKSLVHQ